MLRKPSRWYGRSTMQRTDRAEHGMYETVTRMLADCAYDQRFDVDPCDLLVGSANMWRSMTRSSRNAVELAARRGGDTRAQSDSDRPQTNKSLGNQARRTQRIPDAGRRSVQPSGKHCRGRRRRWDLIVAQSCNGSPLERDASELPELNRGADGDRSALVRAMSHMRAMMRPDRQREHRTAAHCD